MPTCLFFDEMPVVRKVGERILRTIGHETTPVETVAEAIERLESGAEPDLVILSSTGGTPLESDAIRTVRELCPQGIVLVSIVERNLGSLMRFRRAGANGVLFKPFDADGFLKAIHAHTRAAEVAA